jgi:hypothetical protein
MLDQAVFKPITFPTRSYATIVLEANRISTGRLTPCLNRLDSKTLAAQNCPVFVQRGCTIAFIGRFGEPIDAGSATTLGTVLQLALSLERLFRSVNGSVRPGNTRIA